MAGGVSILLRAVLTALAAEAAGGASPVIATADGEVRGFVRNGTAAWLGIPYGMHNLHRPWPPVSLHTMEGGDARHTMLL